MTAMVVLDGESLRLEDVGRVIEGEAVQLSGAARARMEASRLVVEDILRQRRPVYAVSTGVGNLCTVAIPAEDIRALQRNIVRSHAAGVGPAVGEDVVRAMLVLRANALASGYSGVRPALVDTLVSMLNRRVHPVVPEQGSLGASGDLAPLAHLALVVMGEGEAFFQGERLAGGEAMRRAGPWT
jgi:histidine ammonia-lyase